MACSRLSSYSPDTAAVSTTQSSESYCTCIVRNTHIRHYWTLNTLNSVLVLMYVVLPWHVLVYVLHYLCLGYMHLSSHTRTHARIHTHTHTHTTHTHTTNTHTCTSAVKNVPTLQVIVAEHKRRPCSGHNLQHSPARFRARVQIQLWSLPIWNGMTATYQCTEHTGRQTDVPYIFHPTSSLPPSPALL